MILLGSEPACPISRKKKFGFSKFSRTLAAAGVSASGFIVSNSDTLAYPTATNENTTTGVASETFNASSPASGSWVVSRHKEPFENVTAIPSVGVTMPFEKLMETPLSGSSGSSTPAFSHATDANVKLPISYRGGGILPVRTSNPLHIKRNAAWSCTTEYGGGEPSSLAAILAASAVERTLSACLISSSVPGWASGETDFRVFCGTSSLGEGVRVVFCGDGVVGAADLEPEPEPLEP